MPRTLRLLSLVALFMSLALNSSLLAAVIIDPSTAKDDGKMLWYDIRALGLEGQGWKDVKAPYDRLPAKAEKMVRGPVWNLSRNSTGLAVRFVTDAPAIQARWTLTSKNLALPHMPATGVSGLDIYVRDADGKDWHWLGGGRPTEQTNNVTLGAGYPEGKHEFLMYLPLYNGVSSVEIGLPKTAKLWKADERPAENRKSILFYGTSITQGGCASRPGMVHTAILGRKLDRPVINLGFSGNGKMEPEMATLFAELDPAVYVLDCLPNMNAKEIAERADPFVRTLRKAHPKTPILLVEDRYYANSSVVAARKKHNDDNHEALAKVYDTLLKSGVTGLHYLKGDKLLGADGDDTVDGSHPTDLGFMRHADAMLPALTPLLPQPQKRAAIDGYTDQLSYQAGDEIAFHISSSAAKYSLEIARIGAERVVVLKKDNLEGKLHPIPEDASSHGCRWPVALKLPVPAEWKSGYYTGRLEVATPDGKMARSELFFVVRSAHPGKDTKILLQLTTNTANAYCNWGGYSLYAFNGRFNVQGRRVSFDRPIAGQFARWEQPFVEWAEKAGYTLDYAVNSDLEFHPELLRNYKLILSVGHDEYWSAPMRDHLEKFIGDGGNVAFFSGNTCCWQVRSEDNGRALACWKQAFKEDPFYAKGYHANLSSLWSHHLVKRPENTLTGVGFLVGGYHKSHGQLMDGSEAFTVHRPDHWLLAGTNLKRGDAIGGGKNKIAGYECDGCEFVMKDGVPLPTYTDGTPKSFEIVATAPAKWHPDDCEWYEKWQKGSSGHAVLGVYVRGGTVMTVGTTDWSHGLRGGDANVMRITKNVLDRLGSSS